MRHNNLLGRIIEGSIEEKKSRPEYIIQVVGDIGCTLRIKAKSREARIMKECCQPASELLTKKEVVVEYRLLEHGFAFNRINFLFGCFFFFF